MFNDKGYEVVKGAVHEQTLQLLDTEFQMLRDTQFWYQRLTDNNAYGDVQTPESFSWYSAYCFESLMVVLRDKVAAVTGKRLEPAYSYARIYYKGGDLKRHTDRPSCQYSATVCISNEHEPWPIFIEDYEGRASSVNLYPGDMLVYRGDKLAHWREPYQDNRQVQCFIHYVDMDDQYAEYVNDRRPMLGLAADTRPLEQ